MLNKENIWFITAFKSFINKYKTETILFLSITMIFAILYWKFIFCGYAYVVNSSVDVGNDQYYIIYPSYFYALESIKNGSINLFDFSLGFGLSTFNMYSVYLNPFDCWLLLFSTDYIAVGLLLGTYLKYLWIALFAYKFFKLFYANSKTCFWSSIIWTFTSFAVIWGQQYSFLTIIALFTSFMYLLQKLLHNTLNKRYLLITIMTLICIASYYFFYIIGIFSIMYILGCKWLRNNLDCSVFFNIIDLGWMALISILIASVMLLPDLYNFFNSARVSGISSQSGLLDMINTKELVTFISRLINPDLLGGAYGIAYSGSFNYYEAPLLSLSVISIPSSIYMFTEKKNRKKLIVFTIIIIFLITCRIGNFMFTFTKDSYRWTFVISFLIVLSISRFIDNIIYFNFKFKIIVFICTVLTLSLCAIILVIADNANIIDVHKKYMFLVVLTYIICLLVYMFGKRNYLSITIVLAIEFMISYYPAISYRGVSTLRELNQSGYADGTSEVVDMIKDKDPGLYRINKTYDSAFYNDSFVQGYNGTKVYNSVNYQGIFDFFNIFGIERLFDHPNYLSLSTNDILLNGLLSVKYIISNDVLNDKKLFFEHDNKYVYYNESYIPFGRLYKERIESTDKESANLRQLLLYKYFDDDVSISNFDNSQPDIIDSNRLNDIKNIEMTCLENIHFDGKTLKGTIENIGNHNEMLFLSILYSDEAWVAKVDGKEVDTVKINAAFTGIHISPGIHEVTLEFRIPWFNAGAILSFLGLGLLCLDRNIQKFLSKRNLLHLNCSDKGESQ